MSFDAKHRKTHEIPRTRVYACSLLLIVLFIFRISPARANAEYPPDIPRKTALGISATLNPPSTEQQSLPVQQLDIGICLDSNRTLGGQGTLRAVYQWQKDHYRIQTGSSFNGATSQINALFIEVGYDHINHSDFGLNLKFLGNEYGEYDKAANSIIVFLNWDHARYYGDLGLNCRYLNSNKEQLWNLFYYDTNVAEVILYYRLGVRFAFPDQRFLTELEANNFDAMYAGNLGAYGLFVKSKFKLNRQMAFWGILGFRQSGSIALAATYYSTSLSWGAEVSL